jgi:V/A-type H+-transporting ATPase subunit E
MANLAALLDKEASAEIEAILSEARARASEIVANAEEEAKSLVAQRERAIASQHEAALVRAGSSAQLEAASLKLRAQHEVVAGIFDEAEAEIRALVQDPKRYEPVFAALLQEAIDNLSGQVGRITVHSSERTLAVAVANRLAPGATVETSEDLRGGVRLRAAGASTSLENTLFGRLQALRDELASEVAQVLLADQQAQ